MEGEKIELIFMYGGGKAFQYMVVGSGEKINLNGKLGTGSNGAVFEAIRSGDSFSFNKKQLPIRVHEDLELIKEWRARQYAIDLKFKSLKKSRENELLNSLKPLKEAYKRETREGRIFLTAWVIEYLKS